ncbi:MAG: tetraacyldisaccharide 4'-kinase [Hyphomonadaceae bacterium]
MHEPAFWREKDLRSRASAPLTRLLLTPVAALYSHLGARRIATARPYDAGLPVICVGNLTLGGAGKTPVSEALRERITSLGKRAATLSRGYKGQMEGPLGVAPNSHTATQVGDEPLMLAQRGEAWISKDRVAGADAMKAAGVEVVVMDDGHQNPTLKKTLSIVVVDANDPFGNGLIFPKGPLREPVARGLARADAVVLMGDDRLPEELRNWDGPVLRATLTPIASTPPGIYVAFAGIGRPERFFDSLRATEGVELADAIPFADHHMFSDQDVQYLDRLAAMRGARLITTEKDLMRLSPEVRTRVSASPVAARFAQPEHLDRLLENALHIAREEASKK